MNNLKWKDVRKEKPKYGQVVSVNFRHKPEGRFKNFPEIMVAKYAPFRNPTTGKYVVVFVDTLTGFTLPVYQWFPLPPLGDS